MQTADEALIAMYGIENMDPESNGPFRVVESIEFSRGVMPAIGTFFGSFVLLLFPLSLWGLHIGFVAAVMGVLVPFLIGMMLHLLRRLSLGSMLVWCGLAALSMAAVPIDGSAPLIETFAYRAASMGALFNAASGILWLAGAPSANSGHPQQQGFKGCHALRCAILFLFPIIPLFFVLSTMGAFGENGRLRIFSLHNVIHLDSKSPDEMERALHWWTDLNALNDKGLSPLHTAIQRQNDVAIEFLIRKGVDLNLSGQNIQPPLHFATHRGNFSAMNKLLDSGVDVNSSDYYGNTPLMAASATNNYYSAKLLLSRGAKVSAVTFDRTRREFSSLDLAVRNGNIKLASLLLQYGANPLLSLDGYSPLERSLQAGNVEMFKLLFGMVLDKTQLRKVDCVLLKEAIRKNRPEIVDMLVTAGADVNNSCAGQGTLLGALVSMSMDQSLRDQRLAWFKVLFQMGANPNISDINGYTPLHESVRTGDIDVARILVASGANVNVRSWRGHTLLSYALESGQKRMHDYLISVDANQ